MNTPSHHRVHHARNTRYLDKNYGGFLIVWDKLFGTFEPEGESCEYGVTVPPRTWLTGGGRQGSTPLPGSSPYLSPPQYAASSSSTAMLWLMISPVGSFLTK